MRKYLRYELFLLFWQKQKVNIYYLKKNENKVENTERKENN